MAHAQELFHVDPISPEAMSIIYFQSIFICLTSLFYITFLFPDTKNTKYNGLALPLPRKIDPKWTKVESVFGARGIARRTRTRLRVSHCDACSYWLRADSSGRQQLYSRGWALGCCRRWPRSCLLTFWWKRCRIPRIWSKLY